MHKRIESAVKSSAEIINGIVISYSKIEKKKQEKKMHSSIKSESFKLSLLNY
jgi:hypothetical protein